MYGTLFRGFLKFIGSNWAGLSTGYALADFFRWVNDDDDDSKTTTQPTQPQKEPNFIDRTQKAISEFWSSIINAPKWIGALITIFLMFMVYQYFNRKK
jgi:hypothetical protein